MPSIKMMSHSRRANSVEKVEPSPWMPGVTATEKNFQSGKRAVRTQISVKLDNVDTNSPKNSTF